MKMDELIKNLETNTKQQLQATTKAERAIIEKHLSDTAELLQQDQISIKQSLLLRKKGYFSMMLSGSILTLSLIAFIAVLVWAWQVNNQSQEIEQTRVQLAKYYKLKETNPNLFSKMKFVSEDNKQYLVIPMNWEVNRGVKYYGKPSQVIIME